MTDPRSDLRRIYQEIVGNSDEGPHVTGTPDGRRKDAALNIHAQDFDREPTRAEAEEALALLRR